MRHPWMRDVHFFVFDFLHYPDGARGLAESERIRKTGSERVVGEETSDVERGIDEVGEDFPYPIDLRSGGRTDEEGVLENGDQVATSNDNFRRERKVTFAPLTS